SPISNRIESIENPNNLARSTNEASTTLQTLKDLFNTFRAMPSIAKQNNCRPSQLIGNRQKDMMHQYLLANLFTHHKIYRGISVLSD
ncbi:hypothetical protein PENTCL1PPCAC_9880, partial [Pristionchus entomophagus]